LPWSTSLLAAILPPKLVSGFIRPLQCDLFPKLTV